VATSSVDAFSRPVAGLSDRELRRFAFGDRLFRTRWIAAPASVSSLDGLGPLFNRRSCSGCHVRDGRGRPPGEDPTAAHGMTVRLDWVDEPARGKQVPHPRYGRQLQQQALRGFRGEGLLTVRYVERPGRFPDGHEYSLREPVYSVNDLGYGTLEGTTISARIAPAIHGLGLLEAVPLGSLRALEDEEDVDGDGISGRLNRVPSRIDGKTVVGRFGWKAGQPTLRQQAAKAFNLDMGITSSLYPLEESVTDGDSEAAAVSGGRPEIDDDFLEKLTFYLRALAVPARRDVDTEEVRRGETVFGAVGCTSCHVPELKTGKHPAIRRLSRQSIHPYTDLLLHDMGEGLADGQREHRASGREWRTPPLWGIGLVPLVNRHEFLLHDGRARGLQEAILWHGGEAAAARERFKQLPEQDRTALIAFVRSL
jgi:CxxC motif-containing protein (DUF1111 family)